MAEFTYLDIAKMIDHSLLQQTLTDAELEAGLELARAYEVASVCIKPYYVARAAQVLKGTGVKVGTTQAGGMWAYEAGAETTGGIALIGGRAARSTADEVKQYLRGN